MTIDDDRLKEAVEFNRAVKLCEARERVCEAALEWWRSLQEDDFEGAWDAEGELEEAAGQLAELEEQ